MSVIYNVLDTLLCTLYVVIEFSHLSFEVSIIIIPLLHSLKKRTDKFCDSPKVTWTGSVKASLET